MSTWTILSSNGERFPGKHASALILADRLVWQRNLESRRRAKFCSCTRPPPQARKRLKRFSIEYEALPSIHTIEIGEQKPRASGAQTIFLRATWWKMRRVRLREAASSVAGGVFHGRTRTMYIENNGMDCSLHAESWRHCRALCQCRITSQGRLWRLCRPSENKFAWFKWNGQARSDVKEDYPSMIAVMRRFRDEIWRAVKIVYDRMEYIGDDDRHPSRTRHRTG